MRFDVFLTCANILKTHRNDPVTPSNIASLYTDIEKRLFNIAKSSGARSKTMFVVAVFSQGGGAIKLMYAFSSLYIAVF